LANDGVDATIDSHVDEAAPRLPSTNITALAVRPLTAMHTGADAVDIDRDAVLAADFSPVDAFVYPWLQPMLGNPFFSVRELPTRCNWTSWFDNTQKRMDVVRDECAPARNPLPPVHGSATMPSTREHGHSEGVGGGLARAS